MHHDDAQNSVRNIRAAEIRGLNTAWIEEGVVGKPVVFLCHGFPDGASAWNAQIEALKADYHLIAPYVRGCEFSAPSSDGLRRYSSEAVLLDHLEILNQCHIASDTPITVVGHDLGAVHALALTRALGPRATACVVVNGGDLNFFAGRLKNSKQLARSWYMALMQVPALPEALIKFAPESCAWLAERLGGSHDSEHHDHQAQIKRNEQHVFERRTLAPLNQYRAFARELSGLSQQSYSRIRVPLLVLWGREDGYLEPPHRAEWDRVGLNVTIRILPGGHWLHRDRAEVVNPILSEFLALAVSTFQDKKQNRKS